MNSTVIRNKYTRNKEQETNVGSKEKNNIVGELLEIDELHHRFQKLTDQPQSSTDTHTSSINVNKERIEQNRDGLELTNNVKVNINDQINESSKSSITTNRDRSDNENNTPSDTYNNIVIFGDSIPKGINIRNLTTRLSTANCKCHFFGGATSKHFYHYIQPTLNEKNVKTDIAVLHMGTNDILNAEGDKDLIAESVIDIAKECVRLDVKDVFVSSVTANTRRSSTFISAVNNILQDKCATHQFHFIDNSNTKKEHLWKDGLHLNRFGKDLLMNNF